jgi:hypothetical protein
MVLTEQIHKIDDMLFVLPANVVLKIELSYCYIPMAILAAEEKSA